MSNVQQQEQRCPECETTIPGGLEGCRAALHDLAYRFPAAGPQMRLHRLIVDAFCLQHPATYCRSPKSMAAHLGGLCCGLEFDGHPNMYRAIQQWLSGSRQLQRPDPPEQRAEITIHDIATSAPLAHLIPTIEEWAETVWVFWSPHHDLARKWVNAALGEST